MSLFLQDPAISSDQPPGTYPPYDDGVKQDVFIKDANGKILVGRVSLFEYFSHVHL